MPSFHAYKVNMLSENNIQSLWHLTHLRNLPTIRTHGLRSKNWLESKGFKYADIALASAQKLREAKFVNTEKGKRALHDMVPLFLSPWNAMAVTKQDEKCNLVWLEIHTDCVCSDEANVCYSDGNMAAYASKSFYTFKHLADRLDLAVIQRKNKYLRKSEDDGYESRVRGAEFLVETVVPTTAVICAYICTNSAQTIAESQWPELKLFRKDLFPPWPEIAAIIPQTQTAKVEGEVSFHNAFQIPTCSESVQRKTDRDHSPVLTHQVLTVPGSLSGDDQDLFCKLKAWRTELASMRGVPAYVIASDHSLRQLATNRPTNHGELREIHGFGAVKTAILAEEILPLINAHYAEALNVGVHQGDLKDFHGQWEDFSRAKHKNFGRGQRIYHPCFGGGVVTSVQRQNVNIDFDDGLYRTIRESYLQVLSSRAN
jgi:hypothetical protein